MYDARLRLLGRDRMAYEQSDPLFSSGAEDPATGGAVDSEAAAAPGSDIVTIPRWVAMVTTAAAIALVVLHLVFPTLRVDAATLILLAVAALPWLGPVIKSVRFGPVELSQLRVQSDRLRRDVLKVRDDVAEVRRLVVTGATPAQEARLQRDVSHYREYLGRIGIRDNLQDAPVYVVETPEEVSGDPQLPMVSANRDGAIYLLAAEVADSATVALREYTHHALRASERLPPVWTAPARLIESGLAYYLPCSFVGNSVYGSGAGAAYVHDISAPGPSVPRDGQDTEKYSAGGLRWAHWLWLLRAAAGPTIVDPILVSVWFAADVSSTDYAGKTFVDSIRGQLGPDAARAANVVLTRPIRALGPDG